MEKFKLRYIPLIILGVLVYIWIADLVKCEILTLVYYDDFEYAYEGNSMLGEMEYFKVLNCNSESAKVYYVEKDMECSHVLTFEKMNGVWVENQWEVIWSKTGSASEVIYPYWWHFIYGGL